MPFDAARHVVTGAAVPVLEGVRRTRQGSGAAQFSTSDTGTLVYTPGPATLSDGRSLVLTDRDGKSAPLQVFPGPYEHPRVSRDGTRLAVGKVEGREAHVWISDLSRDSAPRR